MKRFQALPFLETFGTEGRSFERRDLLQSQSSRVKRETGRRHSQHEMNFITWQR